MSGERLQRQGLVLALGLALVLADARVAHAAPQTEAAAETLFKEAKQLASQGKFGDACPKYEESQRLSPAAGTLVNLADCYEKLGKTASAWVTFKEASRAAASRKRQDWVKLSTERAAALEAKLAKLTITIEPAARVAGLEIKRDGSTIGPGEWGVPVPVDPGAHVVESSAPGKKSVTRNVTVSPEKVTSVSIGPLEPESPTMSTAKPGDASQPATAVPTPSSPSEPSSEVTTSSVPGRRTLGYVVGGVGLVGVSVGVVTGVLALGKKSDAKTICPSYPDCTDPSAQDPNDSAKSFATISTIGFIAGGALVAAGVFLVVTAPSSKPTALRVTPSLGTRDASLSVLGAF